MSNELMELDTTHNLEISRTPAVILQEAQTAAAALKDVIANKSSEPFILNGKHYLEFEDWQTIARFYGATVGCEWTRPVEVGEVFGYEARAVVTHTSTEKFLSAAEAMCLNDEPNWHKKPLFQLRSMAQTRAMAKALRNVFAWVVVMAGYAPTPSEEMDGVKPHPPKAIRRATTKATDTTAPAPMRFGIHSGVPLCDLPDEGLRWYVRVIEENIADASKVKFIEKNQQSLRELIQEMDSRIDGVEKAQADTEYSEGYD